MELDGTDLRWHHVDMTTRDLNRLAKYVRAHRLELFAARKDAAEAVGISKDTWRRVEEGQVVRESTYVKIEKALGWAAGSCESISIGDSPVLIDTPAGAAPTYPGVQGAAMSPEAIRRAAFEAAREKLPMAPIGDIDAFSDAFVEVLRRSGMTLEEE